MAMRFLLAVAFVVTVSVVATLSLHAKILQGTGGVSITVTQPLAPFDGSVASAPTGTMTNASGTWTFGTTTNGCGDYTVSLNGTAISQTGVAVEQLNGNTYLYSVCSGPWWAYNATSHVFTNIGQAAPHQFTVPPQPIWMTFSAPACANPVTAPCFNGTIYKAPDNTQGGVALAAITTINSDGSSFSGTLTNSPNTTLGTVNAPYNVTAARAFLMGDDNIAYPTTITATPVNGPVIASTALSSSTFVAQIGNAGKTIGMLSSAVASFGQSNPTYSLLTTCGVQCADSSLFAVSGNILKIGSTDLTAARNYAITVVDTESAQNSPFSQPLTIAGQAPTQTITSVSLNGGTNVGTFTGSSASYAGVGPVATACSDTCSGVTISLSTTQGGCTTTNGAGNSSFFMAAADGSIISNGSGSLLTVEGTWGFGASNGAGDWFLTLNGVTDTSNFAVSLEIINGNLYQVNHLNTWFLRNTNTHSWSQVTPPTEAMPSAPQTLVVKPNVAGGTYNVCAIATAMGYSNSPKSGTFVITGSGGGAQPTLTSVSLNGGSTGSFTAPPASSIGVGPIIVKCSNGPCVGITDLLSTSQSVCNATNGADNSSFFVSSADGSIVNAPSASALYTSEGTWTFDGVAADGVDSFIQLNGSNTGWGVILQITNGDLYSKNQVTGQWYHRTGGAWANIGSTPPAQLTPQTPQTLVANANVPIGTYKVCVSAAGSSYSNSPLGAAFTVTGTGFVTSSVCTPTGTQAQADATKAGFNTCALGNDFTVMIPNTVGTGLPSNWLDCALDGDTSAVWHWGFIYSNLVTVPPCSGHVAWNVTDTGGGGNLALQLTLSDADVTTFTNPASSMQTQNKSNTNPVPGPGQFGYAYYEWTFRTDNNVAVNNAFWTWVGPNAGTLAGQSADIIELDFTENLRLNQSQQAINQQGPAGVISFQTLFSNVGLPFTSYHTWGALFTGDGGSNFGMCGYVDGIRQACTSRVYDGVNENLQRRFLIAWLQYLSGSIGTVHQYIKQIKVITCANWQQSGPAGMCPGTTFNGDFYQ